MAELAEETLVAANELDQSSGCLLRRAYQRWLYVQFVGHFLLDNNDEGGHDERNKYREVPRTKEGHRQGYRSRDKREKDHNLVKRDPEGKESRYRSWKIHVGL